MLFNALQQKRTELSQGDGILVLPAPSAWDGKNHWQPSMVVAYRGRVGVIDVSPASDKKMNQALAACGIQVVGHITEKDAGNEAECGRFIDIFPKRLGIEADENLSCDVHRPTREQKSISSSSGSWLVQQVSTRLPKWRLGK